MIKFNLVTNENICTDDSFLGGASSSMSPDGIFINDNQRTMAPDGTYISHISPSICPDDWNSYGTCQMQPDGSYD